MMSNQKQKIEHAASVVKSNPGKKPNDAGKIVVQAHMKIFDPKTKQVYVEGRA